MNGWPLNTRTFRSFIPVELSPVFECSTFFTLFLLCFYFFRIPHFERILRDEEIEKFLKDVTSFYCDFQKRIHDDRKVGQDYWRKWFSVSSHHDWIREMVMNGVESSDLLRVDLFMSEERENLSRCASMSFCWCNLSLFLPSRHSCHNKDQDNNSLFS